MSDETKIDWSPPMPDDQMAAADAGRPDGRRLPICTSQVDPHRWRRGAQYAAKLRHGADP